MVLALCNNSGYSIVTSISHSLANHYNQKNLVNSFGFVIQTLAIFANLLSLAMAYFNIKYVYRYLTIIILQMISYYGMAYFSEHTSTDTFYFILLFVMPMGMAGGIGEPSNIACFSSTIGANNISGWGTGSGIASLLPTMYLLFMNYIDAPFYTIFSLASGLSWVYLVVMYLFLNEDYSNYENNNLDDNIENEIGENNNINNNLINASNNNEQDINNNNNNRRSFMKIYTISAKYTLNLALVYYFDFLIVYTLNEKLSYLQSDSNNYNYISIIIWSIGMLLSRSSLIFVKIKQIMIFTIAIIILSIYYFYLTLSKIYINEYIMYTSIFITGCIAGMSYINVLYLITSTNELIKEEKEIVANICTLSNYFGITFAMGTGLLLGETILKNY